MDEIKVNIGKDDLSNDLEMVELTVIGEISVEILGRTESVTDLLQLASLGYVSLKDVFSHSLILIFNNKRLKNQSIKFKLRLFKLELASPTAIIPQSSR